MRYGSPAPLRSFHAVDDFQNGHASLSRWLHQRALANETSRASRTFVVCVDQAVVGYYALAAGSVLPAELPGSLRRNMPSPVPAIILARLAVDSRHQGVGLGKGLLRDAVARSLSAAKSIGARVLVCHAVDGAAVDFYRQFGFNPSPTSQMTLLLDLAQASRKIAAGL